MEKRHEKHHEMKKHHEGSKHHESEKQLKGGSASTGASYAEHCRTAPANSHHEVPPHGPKAEPVRTNGVPRIAEKHIRD